MSVKSAKRRELVGLLTYVALESDVIGTFIALLKFIQLPQTRNWPHLYFGLERRLVHVFLCILITLSVQAAMHYREETCLARENCLEACKEDYRHQPRVQSRDDGSNSQPCVPIKNLPIGPDSLFMHWYIYPKSHESTNQRWLACREKADGVLLGNLDHCVNLHDVICVRACRDVIDPLVIYPDDRPHCSEGQHKPTKIAEIIKNTTSRSVSNTLICVAPSIICLSIDYPESFRIGLTALFYQFVSVFVRTLLLCTCISKSKRGGARRLGSVITLTVTGLSVFIMAFGLLSIALWLKEALLSLLAGYLIQLGVIVLIRWFILGSIPGGKLDRKQIVCGVRRTALAMTGSVFLNIFSLYSSGYDRLPNGSSSFTEELEEESGDEEYGFY